MNEFEVLCKLASDENWCWKLTCTTCGHSCFRYGFSELARGKSPDDGDWIVYERIIANSNRLAPYKERLGPVPTRFSPTQKYRILRICLYADILSIAEYCKFPDWLGYLGLVLTHMQCNSETYKSVSSKWASQLKELTPEHSQIYSRLNEMVENNDILLNIKDLEACESYFQTQSPYKATKKAPIQSHKGGLP
jgi:hypothetical protein